MMHDTWIVNWKFKKVSSNVRNSVVAAALISPPNFTSLLVCCQLIDTVETGVFFIPNQLSFVSNNQSGGIYNTNKIKTRQKWQVQYSVVWVSWDVKTAENFLCDGRCIRDFCLIYNKSYLILRVNACSVWRTRIYDCNSPN